MKKFLILPAVLICLTAWEIHAWALSEQKVAEAFGVFQKEWMDKLSRHGIYGPKHMTVRKSRDGSLVVASYKELGAVKGSRVKKTDSKACPFVGVLHYEEIVFESRGPTEQIARKGPFREAGRTNITEIFRFADGKWIY
ncbi:hypothetical protein SAMN02746041_02057 [Desulfacinum hydrothermale DSM 13146]|uniref:DUF4440 domain-containing protein n=1 Tax=Desulfacinum hydrothermale DSM 13146 TaxID=1121390 RepID=A0A1W1XLA6_9BACT|nr:hypothetical protein [Desulfacinum hydrothermale]SMC24607.1 hypothetical protein SAMN02746041_02057 [Desulfacinum hydrothermale DSM 13146]